MKLTIQDKPALVSIMHLLPEEFKEKFPNLVESTCLARNIVPNRLTISEVNYDGVVSRAIATCHEVDQFSRKGGSSRALRDAMLQHPSLKGKANKGLRQEVYAKMFRAEPSPYDSLQKLVRADPDLAVNLTEIGKAIKANPEMTVRIFEEINRRMA